MRFIPFWAGTRRRTDKTRVCAEFDVVDVNADEAEYKVVLRMTVAQHRAYRAGRFAPRYTPSTSMDLGLNEDGDVIEIYDVTDQGL
jgi:hypothetical protein